eukprot:comp20048_c0_seq1/m.39328 comp20048_c0_seq1/g.39328  ORF comp20048_c0_seq1/g.39328 comp20048_c0_seq1/m.39328 type:complete len:376 (+) comp20048_c0_seq1:2-1129(+)
MSGSGYLKDILKKTTSIRWVPSSFEELAKSEIDMLKPLQSRFKSENIPVDSTGNNYIHCLSFEENCPSDAPHLILTHGYGSGLAFYVHNFDELAKKFKLHAIDWTGFGCSARIKYQGKTFQDAEQYFLEPFERFLEKKKLDRFYLAGHSLGGYISGRYAIRHPETLKGLLLVSPVGVPEPPPHYNTYRTRSKMAPLYWTAKLADVSASRALRLAGPWAPGFIEHFNRMRGMAGRYKGLYDANYEKIVGAYTYHVNTVTSGCGDSAANGLLGHLSTYACEPLIRNFDAFRALNVSFFYGEFDWMDAGAGHSFAMGLRAAAIDEARALGEPEKIIEYFGFRKAGHNMYADNPGQFNGAVEKFVNDCEKYWKLKKTTK